MNSSDSRARTGIHYSPPFTPCYPGDAALQRCRFYPPSVSTTKHATKTGEIMQAGYEIFYAQPNTVSEKQCAVCGTTCERTENVYGPASYAEAVGKKYDFYDVFVCPNVGKDWHEQALRLVLAIAETPSKRVAALMMQDLNDILEEQSTR